MKEQGTALELQRQDVVWAYVILRLALGINIFVHGLVRIGDIPGFVQSQVRLYKDLPVPGWLIAGPAFLIPIVELIAGFLIVIGLKTRIAIAAGFLLMLPLIFGTCLFVARMVVGCEPVDLLPGVLLRCSRQD